MGTLDMVPFMTTITINHNHIIHTTLTLVTLDVSLAYSAAVDEIG